MSEADMQTECNAILRRLKIWHYHIEAGRGSRGKTHRKGIPDLLIIHKGKTYAYELKMPGKRPTDAQFKEMSYMESAGAIVGWGDSVEKFIYWLSENFITKG